MLHEGTRHWDDAAQEASAAHPAVAARDERVVKNQGVGWQRIVAVLAVLSVVGAATAVLVARSIGDSPVATLATPFVAVAGSDLIGPSGGRLAVDAVAADGGEVIGEIAIEFQAGAVGEVAEITMSASPGSNISLMESVNATPAQMALSAFAATGENPQIHPVYGAAILSSSATSAGPAIEFGPDGLTFDVPAEVSLPLELLGLGPDETAIVLLGNDDEWDVVPVEVGSSTATFPVHHFSWARLLRIPRNAFGNPLARATPENLRAAFEIVQAGPLQDVVNNTRQQLVCPETVAFDGAKVPGLYSLLDYLAFETNRPTVASAGAGQRIADRFEQHYKMTLDSYRAANSIPTGAVDHDDVAPHDIEFGQLMKWTMDETDNDVFQALLLAHDVLRDNRASPSVQGSMVLVRGDGGDERGARYHLLGTAIYGFAYAHHVATGVEFWYAPSPFLASSLEEAWVSGDINTDTVEYVVDLEGVKLGQQLYRDYVERSAGKNASDLGLGCGVVISPADGAGTTTPAASSTAGQPAGGWPDGGWVLTEVLHNFEGEDSVGWKNVALSPVSTEAVDFNSAPYRESDAWELDWTVSWDGLPEVLKPGETITRRVTITAPDTSPQDYFGQFTSIWHDGQHITIYVVCDPPDSGGACTTEPREFDSEGYEHRSGQASAVIEFKAPISPPLDETLEFHTAVLNCNRECVTVWRYMWSDQ